MFAEGVLWQHGKSRAVDRRMPDQPEAREGKTGLHGMAERPVLPKKPGNAGGGKGPWFKGNAGRSEGEEIGVSLRTPESVWKLQGALHAKAKGEPSYRFYSLYDKIHRKDVLLQAWKCCRANGGAAGVDGQSFEQIEAWGLERWLEELAEEIRKKTYRPQAVRRVWIPKPGWQAAASGSTNDLEIGSCRWRRSSYWNRSLRRIWPKSNMGIGLDATRMAQCVKSTGC